MIRLTNYPVVILVISLVVLWLATRFGSALRSRVGILDDNTRKDFDIVRAGALTLLALIIGFTFSMASGRYDQRKTLEEDEANAIGTEYVRVDCLPGADTARTKALLIEYLDQRILFYQSRSTDQLRNINASTAQLQDQLWSAVQIPGSMNPSPMTALAVSGMNDVLNSQGYTQAAWWNRIPSSAWWLLSIIAICSNLLIGYGARTVGGHFLLTVAVPFIVAISFFFIADIDSPRGGTIRVNPQNLISLSQSLQGH